MVKEVVWIWAKKWVKKGGGVEKLIKESSSKKWSKRVIEKWVQKEPKKFRIKRSKMGWKNSEKINQMVEIVVEEKMGKNWSEKRPKERSKVCKKIRKNFFKKTDKNG